MADIEDLFRTHERAIFAYMLRMVPSRDEAEELTQETFVRACAAALRFRGDASARTWLFAIARNVLREARRRPDAIPFGEIDVEARPVDPLGRLQLAQSLSKLGAADREALLLVDAIGFSPREFADVIGVAPEAARVRLHRARRRLRALMEEEDGLDG